MTFELKTKDQLVELAMNGAGFTIDSAVRPTADLAEIAAAAAQGGARITFSNVGARQQADLIQIARAGRGHISFAA